MPNITFKTLDEVPEGLREAAQTDAAGNVVVKVVPQAKLDEFRDRNIAVSKERDDLAMIANKAKELLGDDFEAAAASITELRTIADRVKDGQLVENKGLEEAVAERTAKMRSDLQAENSRIAQEAAALKNKWLQTDQKLRQTYVDRAVTDVVLDESTGVHHKALGDILNRAYGVFEVSDDGKLTAKRGEAVLYGSDGATPLTPKEWINSLKDESPYFFKGSSGGGSNGGDGGGIGGFTTAEIAKMSPEARLQIANGEFGKR